MASELDYSTAPGSNVSINGVGIAGTDLPSNLDNAMREIAANRANAQPRALQKTANYAATKDDFGKTFVFSGAFQLTIPTIATLATGWNIYAEAAAGSPLTIVRSGSNTINGATSITILPGKRCRIFVSQSATDLKADIQLTALSANAALLLADTNVPRLSTANTWAGTNTFVAVAAHTVTLASALEVNASVPQVVLRDTDVNATARIYSGNGQLRLEAGANGSGDATSSGTILFSGYGLANVSNFEVQFGGSARTIWHAGNMGPGSGLNADILDGQQGAWYQDLANSTGTLPSARLSGNYSFNNLGLSGQLTLTGAVPYVLFTDTDTSLSSQVGMANNSLVMYAGGNQIQFAGGTGATDLSAFQVRYSGSLRDIWHAGNLAPGPLATATGVAPASNIALAGFNSSGAFVTMLAPTNSLAMQSTVNNDNWFGADLTVGNGGTGASTAAAARTNLGIGPLGPATGLAPAGNIVLAGFGSTGLFDTLTVPTNSLAIYSTINNTNWNGTDLSITNGGTGASDAATARSNLGLGALSTLAAGGPAPAGQVKLAGIDAAGAAAYAGSIDTSNSLAFQATVNNADWFGTDLAIANGGTGASTATDAIIAFINGAVPVAPGGSIRILCQTAAGTPSTALINTSTGAISGITAL